MGTAYRNVLWLTMDHVTFHHYKNTLGARPVLDTYERLCREGVSFTNCKSVHPLCMPARASMLTGLYAHKHGKLNNDPQPEKGARLICQTLREHGFDLGYFGKNHSGYTDSRFCFDGFFPSGYGNPYLTPEYRAYLEENGYQPPMFRQEWGQHLDTSLAHPDGLVDLSREDLFNCYASGYLDNTDPVHEVDFLVAKALDWLDHRDSSRPFVLRLDTWGPHHAYQPPKSVADEIHAEDIRPYPSLHTPYTAGEKPEFYSTFLGNLRGMHAAICSESEWQLVASRAYAQYTYIDRAFGRLIDAVRARGYGENTCILMTADHGDGIGTHGGMFDKCGDMQEELMDVPMVLYIPGRVGGQTVPSLTSNLDVAPTILEMAGLPVPSYMDGRSLLSLADGKIAPREVLMSEHYGHFQVHLQQRTLYKDCWKYTATENELHELYNLQEDPFEMHTLIHVPQAQETAQQMRAALLAEMERTGDDSVLKGTLAALV